VCLRGRRISFKLGATLARREAPKGGAGGDEAGRDTVFPLGETGQSRANQKGEGERMRLNWGNAPDKKSKRPSPVWKRTLTK